MKKTDLSFKMKKLLEPCKHWEEGHKRAFMPVVEYAHKLEKQVKELEASLKRFQAPPLPSIFPEGSTVSRSLMTPPEPPAVVLTRDERVHLAIQRGEQGTDTFKRMLKFMKLTEEQAFEIYERVERGEIR